MWRKCRGLIFSLFSCRQCPSLVLLLQCTTASPRLQRSDYGHVLVRYARVLYCGTLVEDKKRFDHSTLPMLIMAVSLRHSNASRVWYIMTARSSCSCPAGTYRAYSKVRQSSAYQRRRYPDPDCANQHGDRDDRHTGAVAPSSIPCDRA